METGFLKRLSENQTFKATLYTLGLSAGKLIGFVLAFLMMVYCFAFFGSYPIISLAALLFIKFVIMLVSPILYKKLRIFHSFAFGKHYIIIIGGSILASLLIFSLFSIPFTANIAIKYIVFLLMFLLFDLCLSVLNIANEKLIRDLSKDKNEHICYKKVSWITVLVGVICFAVYFSFTRNFFGTHTFFLYVGSALAIMLLFAVFVSVMSTYSELPRINAQVNFKKPREPEKWSQVLKSFYQCLSVRGQRMNTLTNFLSLVSFFVLAIFSYSILVSIFALDFWKLVLFGCSTALFAVAFIPLTRKLLSIIKGKWNTLYRVGLISLSLVLIFVAYMLSYFNVFSLNLSAMIVIFISIPLGLGFSEQIVYAWERVSNPKNADNKYDYAKSSNIYNFTIYLSLCVAGVIAGVAVAISGFASTAISTQTVNLIVLAIVLGTSIALNLIARLYTARNDKV